MPKKIHPMSRTIKILAGFIVGVGIVLLLVFAYVSYSWDSNNKPCIPEIPEKFGQIPPSARWIGGCDGGFWYHILDVDAVQKKYRIGIYYDHNGKLIVEDNFYISDDCGKIYQNKDDLYMAIIDYDFSIILTQNQSCYLIPAKAM